MRGLGMQLGMTGAAADGLARPARVREASRRGFTIVELIVAITILLVLTTMALPMVQIQVKREKEKALRYDLHEMRTAIDRYKDAADRGLFQVQFGTDGYPPTLRALTEPIEGAGKTYRFLRRIPVDPMTGNKNWGLQSTSDSPNSDSWGGDNVFNVYSRSQGTGLNGVPYRDW